MSFLVAGIDYINQAAINNPTILGERTASIVGLSTLLYRYIVKPLSNIFADAKKHRERVKRLSSDAQLPAEETILVPTQAPEAPVIEKPEPVTPIGDDF